MNRPRWQRAVALLGSGLLFSAVSSSVATGRPALTAYGSRLTAHGLRLRAYG
jgi:hypothetical protein